MATTIRHIAVHFLEKEPKKTDVNIDYSDGEIAKNDFAFRLIEEVHKAVNDSPSLKNASFKEDEENIFTKSLKNYLESPNDNNFKKFTRSLELLKEKIAKEALAKGGYYLFVDYTIEGARYLSVILLRKKSGLNIIKEGGTYVLNSTENINIDKIAMGVRLNLAVFNSSTDSRNYLALITTQQDGEVSGYFKDWILASGLIKDAVNTENIIKIIKSIPLPLDEEGEELFTRSQFNRAIFDHVNSRKDKRVNIYEISEAFYGVGNKTAIKDYADAQDIILDPEFKRNSAKWLALITIRASVPGIKLDVDYNKIGQDGVEFNEDKVIINSKELAAIIKKQYERY